jgi:protease IV
MIDPLQPPAPQQSLPLPPVPPTPPAMPPLPQPPPLAAAFPTLGASPVAAQAATAAAATNAPLESGLEKLAGEFFRYQRGERRWRNFWRFSWLLLGALFIWGLLSFSYEGSGGPGGLSSPHTAVIDLRGEIAPETSASAESLIGSLRAAFEEPSAQAVVLRCNSPGGSPVQAGMVNDEIRRLKAKHRKKLYAVVEELCASGAYYIAVAADEILVDKASLVGSIGVLMDGFGVTGLMDKVGVERRLITAGDNKGMLDPFSPLTPKQKAYTQAMIAQVHQQFIDVVRAGRGTRLKESRDTFSGLVWNGEEAVRQGLADRLGTVDYVASELVHAEELVDYTRQDNVAERLAKRFGASFGHAVGASAVKAMRELAPMR